MSKHDKCQKSNQELERNINAYLRKCIEGASKQYKKKFFEQKKVECYLDEIEQLVVDNSDIFDNLHNEDFSEDLVFLAEQSFESSYLSKGFLLLTPKQKLVIVCKYVHDFPESYIAHIMKITKQAVANKRNAALKRLHSSYKK